MQDGKEIPMILETGTMRLFSIREVLRGAVNDVLVCVREDGAGETYYTVWLIREAGVARRILEAFWRRQREMEEWTPLYVECFFHGPRMCFSFPYFQERPLRRFYRREGYRGEERKRIWLGLAGECMATGLPDSLLYLALVQDQIHLERSGRIRIGYMLDLAGYDAGRGEQDCTKACAEQILWMLEEERGRGQIGRMLIERKLDRRGYGHMRELYQDVRLAGCGEGSGKFKNLKRLGKRLRHIDRKHPRRILRIFMICCLLLGGLAFCMVLSQIIWGEIPFLRLFHNPFETIGTESLLQ